MARKSRKNLKSKRKFSRKRRNSISFENHNESFGFLNYRACYKNGKKVPCREIENTPLNFYYRKLK